MVNTTYKKYVQAINFFARQSEENSVNRMKLLKLLWLSDRLHLLKYGRLTIDVDYVAMQFGPVPSQIMNLSHNTSGEYACDYLEATRYSVTSKADLDTSLFTKSEIEVYTSVWNRFSEYSQYELKELSHQYPEWLRYENIFTTRNTSVPMIMDDFFIIPEQNEATESSFFDIEKERIEYAKTKYKESLQWDQAYAELAADREIRREKKRKLREEKELS